MFVFACVFTLAAVISKDTRTYFASP